MALARALKNVQRSAKPSKGGSSQSGTIQTKKGKQYNFPKDTAAVGPHYKQPDLGVSTCGGMK